MRKTKFFLGVILSFSLLTSLAGCGYSSDQSTNFEKQSTIVSENEITDRIESDQPADRKSDIQAEQSSEKTANVEKKSKQDNTINANSESNPNSNSADTSEKTNGTTRNRSTADTTSKENSSDTGSTHLSTTSSNRTSNVPTEPAIQTEATSTATTPVATTSPPTTTEAVPDTIRVQISVDCINAYKAGNEIAQAISSEGWILGATVYEMPKNSTAYDLLMATGLVIGSTSTNLGVYVYSIQSLAEFALGGSSGWIYTVNGSMPSVGVDSYILQPGDIVRFSYTIELGDI
ncbi:MAG TPA: DUF4430 domain-containing protein [Clostridiaceae bacterium]|nr:DUF4430 domain-containing protein [Clostridiaceae bacterium]